MLRRLKGNIMQWPWLLVVVTVLYAGQVVQSAWQGQYAQAVIVVGYVIANVGLIVSMVR
ncbi:MAG: hypothetical protein WD407_08770 [Rhodospirillales bacterium]